MNKELYKSAIANAVLKVDGHKQMDMPVEYAGEQRLYTITTICYGENFKSTRCVGVCSSFERAIVIVERNEGDIWEASYDLVVVEAILDNCVYGNVIGEDYWFVWDGSEDGKYVAILTPKEFESCFGWGVG